VTRPAAPFRIPVGKGIADELRRKGEERVGQAAAAQEFLRSPWPVDLSTCALRSRLRVPTVDLPPR
jgi:hypothetical protein